jgi:hypothetical protein
MTTDGLALAAFIIMLLPMVYFLFTSPTFLLVKLDIPQVTRMMRGHFHGYFLVLSVAAVLGTIAFLVAGRPLMALVIALVAAFAVLARPWFLRRMDAALAARDAGDTEAVRRLRRLHWGGMACNAVQVTAFIASIPYVFANFG